MGVPFLLDRLDALEHRDYHVDIVDVSKARFSRES